MGINNKIFNEINHKTDKYDYNSLDVNEFLTESCNFLRRQKKAIEIIEDIMTTHGKKELLRYVIELAKVELGIRELEPWLRDHVVHALLSFLLGIYIHEQFLQPKGKTVDPFQWKLAGLFHDVGYPVQIAKDIIVEPFTKQINSIKHKLGVSRPDVIIKINPDCLCKLQNGINSLSLIQNHLDSWNLQIDAQDEYDKMVNSGNVCHGILSSLSVLYVIDMMYEKYNPKRDYKDKKEPRALNWNQAYFENDVVPACAAVFVHNLPTQCFQSAPLDYNNATLPYLLRLSDCLQDWDRPSATNKDGFPDTAYDINVKEGRLIFSISDQDRKIKIEKDVLSTLVTTDINIVHREINSNQLLF